MEAVSVYCAVRTGSLKSTRYSFVLKGLNLSFSWNRWKQLGEQKLKYGNNIKMNIEGRWAGKIRELYSALFCSRL
jgi:hypothetical protein